MYAGERNYQKVQTEKYQYAAHNPIDYRNHFIGHKALQFRCYGTFYYVHKKHCQQNADEKRYLFTAFLVTYCHVYGHEPKNPHSRIGYIEDKAL